jgi:hypothetical protein
LRKVSVSKGCAIILPQSGATGTVQGCIQPEGLVLLSISGEFLACMSKGLRVRRVHVSPLESLLDFTPYDPGRIMS